MRYGCAKLKVPGGTLAKLQVLTVCWLQCMKGLNSARTAGTGEHDAALHNDGPQSFLVDTLIDKQRYFRTGFSAEPDQKWIIHKPSWAAHLFYPNCMIPTGVGLQAQMMCQSTNKGCKKANQRSSCLWRDHLKEPPWEFLFQQTLQKCITEESPCMLARREMGFFTQPNERIDKVNTVQGETINSGNTVITDRWLPISSKVWYLREEHHLWSWKSCLQDWNC